MIFTGLRARPPDRRVLAGALDLLDDVERVLDPNVPLFGFFTLGAVGLPAAL